MLRSLHTPVLSCIYNTLIRTQRKFILQGKFRNSSIIFLLLVHSNMCPVYKRYLCTCMCLCVLVCACACLYALVRVCMRLCVLECACACFNVLLCTYLYVLACACVYLHVLVCACVCCESVHPCFHLCVCVYMDGRAGRPNTAHTESAGTGVLPTTILNDYLMRYDYLRTSIAV